jgi:GNAT superfamily N-acetyltransferase
MYSRNQIKKYIRDVGWIHFLTYPLRQIQSKFVIEKGNLYYFLTADIAERNAVPPIIVKEATLDDLDKNKEINLNTPSFREFLKNNDILIFAIINEKIIGHFCLEKKEPKKFSSLINLKVDELWIRDVFLSPNYRNRGIYTMILAFAASQARKQGYNKLFVDIRSNNQHSIEIHTKKFKFIHISSYLYLKILFYEHTWENFE